MREGEKSASPPHPYLRAKVPRPPLEGIEKENYMNRGILFSVYCLCSLLGDREVSAHSGSPLDPQVGISKRASLGPECPGWRREPGECSCVERAEAGVWLSGS